MAEDTGLPQWALYTTATPSIYWNAMQILKTTLGTFYLFACGSQGISNAAYPIF
jgi:hypothetical protein